MTSVAPLLETFFLDRLLKQQRASPHTIAAYRDTFRLLLGFLELRLQKPPWEMLITDLGAPLIADFLDSLEKDRKNTIRTRNARLAAIRSFFRDVARREPALLALAQRVLALPQKRGDRHLVRFLDRGEQEALLAAPAQGTWNGRRDHALLLVILQTGLRVSEAIGLKREDVVLATGPHVRCWGKGRKERCTPLRPQTVAVLRTWLLERGGAPSDPVFPSRRGGALSRDAVERLVASHAATAGATLPSLNAKRVSPHVLRHTTAVELLRAGVDRSVIALWLGHESVETTQIYLDADLAMKERALARTTPPSVARGRFRPDDRLMAFLTGL
jgi:site-specific recombinase XerD